MHRLPLPADRTEGHRDTLGELPSKLVPAMTRTIAAITLALFLLAPAHASEHDPELISVLSHFHHDPADELLEGFEPGLMESLLAIVDDPSVLRLARLRAIHALGRYPEESRVIDRLRALALEIEGDPRVRLAVVGTLGYRLGDRPETTDVLAEVLRDPDPGVRARAVRTLSHIGGERAESILSGHRLVERNVVVRDALRTALEARREAPLPPEGRLQPAAARDRAPLEPVSPLNDAHRGEEETR